MELRKLQNNKWQVMSTRFGSIEEKNFNTIEEACEYLVKYGIKNANIDHALIEMTALGHNVANFTVTGKFIYSGLEL